MITRVKVLNYRCFKFLDFTPRSGLNILVGDNEAGKSTLLEIIELLLSGRVRGRWASEDLNPYWFNSSVVGDFFDSLKQGEIPLYPQISLEIHFDAGTPGTEIYRGLHNEERLDVAGISMKVFVDEAQKAEFQEYIAQSALPEVLPTDFYKVEWRAFSGEPLTRQPFGLGVTSINQALVPSNHGIDYKLRNLIRDFVQPADRVTIATEYRKAKAFLNDGPLKVINKRILAEADSFGLAIEMDQGATSNWDRAVSPHIGSIPFSMLGQGKQAATRVALAMTNNADKSNFILIEEPENHHSHTGLMRLLKSISDLSDERQTFITTHSSYVLNRLGFDSIHLVSQGRIVPLSKSSLTNETVNYFKRLSGFETLRLAIASKAVIVEGPSDEMIFNATYQDLYGREPRDDGIDVVSLGTSGKRALELAQVLGNTVAVIRDNDNREPNHWHVEAGGLLKPGTRAMFIGQVDDGPTLEPQFLNAGNEQTLRSLLNLDDAEQLEEKMSSDKVGWALAVAESVNAGFRWPKYMSDAAKFINGE